MRVLAYSVISLSYAIYLGLDVFIAEKTSLQLLHLCYLFFTHVYAFRLLLRLLLIM